MFGACLGHKALAWLAISGKGFVTNAMKGGLSLPSKFANLQLH